MPFAPDKLRALRESRGESRQQSAVGADCSMGALANYERGVRSPAAAVLERLADHFGVSIDDLFDRAAS